jgi:hypothetical protein
MLYLLGAGASSCSDILLHHAQFVLGLHYGTCFEVKPPFKSTSKRGVEIVQ